MTMTPIASSYGADQLARIDAAIVAAGEVVSKQTRAKYQHDRTLRRDPVVSVREFGINARDFGAVGDLATDDTAAMQELFDAAWRNGAGRTCWIPKGDYRVTRPLIYYPRMAILGEGAPGVNNCARIVQDCSRPWPADRGVLETQNFSRLDGNNEYAHAVRVADLQIGVWNTDYKSPNRAAYGIVLMAGGESSEVCRVHASRFQKANHFYPGSHAVLTSVGCTGMLSDGVGMLFDQHPLGAGYKNGIVRGDSKSGSARIWGFSGDTNGEALIKATGSGAYDCAGLKSEYNSPAILVAGGGTNTTRQRWDIRGYRSEQQAMAGTHTFIKVIGTAQPQIVAGAGAAFNCDYLLEDTVGGRHVIDTADGHAFEWDPIRGKFG